VDEMPLMWREKTLFMQWCIDCHRDPGPSLRPAALVFSMEDRNRSEDVSGEQLRSTYHVTSETNCSICHY
jgi:mono/diheme cytochrome c family protein